MAWSAAVWRFLIIEVGNGKDLRPYLVMEAVSIGCISSVSAIHTGWARIFSFVRVAAWVDVTLMIAWE